MKLDLRNLGICNSQNEFSVIRLNNNGDLVELRDNNHIQYFWKLSDGQIKKRSYCEDYIYLNHRKKNRFTQLKNGNIYVPKGPDDWKYEKLLAKKIDERFYSRGVIFSEIDIPADRLIIISRCPESEREKNNNFYIESFLNNTKGQFNYYKRPIQDDNPDNEIIFGIFDLKGNLKKDFYLQSCDVQSQYLKCKISTEREELMVYSNERTYRFNYNEGQILGVYEGESVDFINSELLGHWEWQGYDSWIEGHFILNSKNKIIGEIDTNKLRPIFYMDKTVIIGDYLYCRSYYTPESDFSSEKVFRFKINNWNHASSANLTLKIHEKFLGNSKDLIFTYLFNDNLLEINQYDVKSLNFKSIKNNSINYQSQISFIETYYCIENDRIKNKSEDHYKTIYEEDEIRDLTYRFKDELEYGVIYELNYKVIEFLKAQKIKFDVIIPVPPSILNRPYQPVYELAKKISTSGYKVDFNYLIKLKETPPVKKINYPAARKKILKDIFDVRDSRYKNKNILLLDDKIRSGDTLNEIGKAIKEKGMVNLINALTLTKAKI